MKNDKTILVTLETFDEPEEAYLRKTLLAAHGIEAAVIHESAHLLLPIGVCPIALAVAETDREQALAILRDHPIPQGK